MTIKNTDRAEEGFQSLSKKMFQIKNSQHHLSSMIESNNEKEICCINGDSNIDNKKIKSCSMKHENQTLVPMILMDFSNNSHHHQYGDNDGGLIHEIRKWELLLKKKFSLQQEGKKKWLLNRELKYKDFFQIEFMDDKEFLLNHTKKYGYGLKFASPKLKQDRDFLMKVIQLSKDGFKVDVGELNHAWNIISGGDKCGDEYLKERLENDEMFFKKYFRGIEKKPKLQSLLFETLKHNRKAFLWLFEILRPGVFWICRDFTVQIIQVLFPEFEYLKSFEYSNKEFIMKVVKEFGFFCMYQSNSKRIVMFF